MSDQFSELVEYQSSMAISKTTTEGSSGLSLSALNKRRARLVFPCDRLDLDCLFGCAGLGEASAEIFESYEVAGALKFLGSSPQL